ncbi:MAG: adenosine kinase, partial [Prevotellaceae bacterium]|nr:adenosine kinase [Prevotellaceae bacterium]
LGLDTAFIGKVGKDHYGDFYRQSLLELGARPHLFVHPTLPSGVAATFISPDGERTFGTYLGAAATQHADELSASLFKGFTCFYIEGYMVQDHDLIVRALSLAKESGLQICIDLASYNIVLQERDFFEQLIDQYVDIVFANEEEARAFSGREDPVEALHAIAPLCSIAVVKARKRGSYIRKGTNLVHVGAPPVANVVDTTAAGDYFAAGFLYGLASGFSLEKCGKTGSLLAGEIIQLIGAELSAGRWESIKTNIHSL